jgi:transposase
MLTLLSTHSVLSQKTRAQAWPGAHGVALTAVDRAQLDRWARSSTTTQRVAMRSVIVLLAGTGLSDAAIAAELGVTRRTVARWRGRYAEGGTQEVTRDRPGRGRKPGRNPEVVERIVSLTARGCGEDGVPWSARSLARHLGISHATVQRVWKERGLR